MEKDQSFDPHLEIGRRLYAAVLSAKLGLGMDETLQKYVPHDLHESWGDLAWTLQCGLNQRVVEQMTERNRSGKPPGQKGS